MKTLYININGEAIKSDENIEVIGSAGDSIDESFYISLGMAIADGVTGIKYKPLVSDFAKAKPKEFKSFTDQWNEVKAQLLGDNPSGVFEFVLSSEYLEWLKMNDTYSFLYYNKYQIQHEPKVTLKLDELYEDTIDFIRRKVIRFLRTEENYKNFDEFVVNDEAVTHRSLLVRSIKSKFEDIAFVLFEKWENSRKVQDEANTLSEETKTFSTKSVILHDILNDNPEWFDRESLDYSFYKGKTVNDVEEERYDNWGNPISKYFDFYGFVIGLSKVNEIIESEEEHLNLYSIYFYNADTFTFYKLGGRANIPSFYHYLGVDWGKDLSEIRELFVNAGFKIEEESPDKLCFKTPFSTKYRAKLSIEFYSGVDDGLNTIIWNCYSFWNNEERCPECGTNDIEDDGTGYHQYQCNRCGHKWRDEEENKDDEKETDNDADDLGSEDDIDSYDKLGNPISNYFEINGVTLGKTTRQEIVDMGGILKKPINGDYEMPNFMHCYFESNSPYVNKIIIYNEEQIPYLYKNIVGLSFGYSRVFYIRLLENIGFTRDLSEDLTESIKCDKYKKTLKISVSFLAGVVFAFIFKCE